MFQFRTVLQHLSGVLRKHDVNFHSTQLDNRHYITFTIMARGKANPLQVWRGPEGSSKLRIPEFLNNRHRPPVPPENIPSIHFC